MARTELKFSEESSETKKKDEGKWDFPEEWVGREDGQKSFLYSSSQFVPQNLGAWKSLERGVTQNCERKINVKFTLSKQFLTAGSTLDPLNAALS